MLRGLKRLNRYEKRILNIAKMGGKYTTLKQLGHSRRTKEGFRFPIYYLGIGKPRALDRHPAGLVAGVHGLETIGIRILLDFLEHVVDPDSPGYLPEIHKGKIGIHCIPILNPGGVALKRRSNPAGVDLMRNSGLDGDKPIPFFGGQKLSSKLPYFRGYTMEPESRALARFIMEHFFHKREKLMPVVDIHSGFGSMDHVWWPFARTKEPCIDDPLYQQFCEFLKTERGHSRYKYESQSESYTTHGDLWDRFYDHYQDVHSQEEAAGRLLPLTLEVGTWSDIREEPSRLFTKKGIFNPARHNKGIVISRYRRFLRDVVKLAAKKPEYWQKNFSLNFPTEARE